MHTASNRRLSRSLAGEVAWAAPLCQSAQGGIRSGRHKLTAIQRRSDVTSGS